MTDPRRGLAVVCLSVVLAGCASVVGDADAGPNPGGGFYEGSNINVGHINLSYGSFYNQPDTSVGQATPYGALTRNKMVQGCDTVKTLARLSRV